MIDLSTFALFFCGALALVAVPGPDFVYVLSRSVSQGRMAGVIAALGISVGMLIHTLLATIGLSAVLYSSALAFIVIKYVGAAYLVYLGVVTVLGRKAVLPRGGVPIVGTGKVFKQALLTNVLNPKASITFMAFMPQFLSGPEGGALEIMVLGLTICTITVSWFTLVGLIAGILRKYVLDNEAVGNAFRYVAGTILISFGLRLAWLEELPGPTDAPA